MRGRAPSKSLSGEAYNNVRQRILRGELKLGQVISRRTLAAEMGMSFLPVSEALLRLEVEGLLESRPRAGTRVRIPTPRDVEGHFVVREALETQAARLFALKASPAEKAALVKLAVQLDNMAARPENDRSEYLTRHERLHRKIAEYTRCQALADAIEQTHALASTWMCVGSGQHMPRRHQTLLEALAGGDTEAAAEAMREHVRSSQQEALRRLSPYFKLQKTRGVRYTRSAKRQPHVVLGS
ncbi:MAG: GntR family transcriptional regulator [Acidobacteriota bacterium]|nr:GntR family transcriptional regulator [Acidobacteriota bacterium]